MRGCFSLRTVVDAVRAWQHAKEFGVSALPHTHRVNRQRVLRMLCVCGHARRAHGSSDGVDRCNAVGCNSLPITLGGAYLYSGIAGEPRCAKYRRGWAVALGFRR